MMPTPRSASEIAIRVRTRTRSRMRSQAPRAAKKGAVAWMNRTLATVVSYSAVMKEIIAAANVTAMPRLGQPKRLSHCPPVALLLDCDIAAQKGGGENGAPEQRGPDVGCGEPRKDPGDAPDSGRTCHQCDTAPAAANCTWLTGDLWHADRPAMAAPSGQEQWPAGATRDDRSRESRMSISAALPEPCAGTGSKCNVERTK